MQRGWMSKNWRAQKEPLQQISGNVGGFDSPLPMSKAASPDDGLLESDLRAENDDHHNAQEQNASSDGRSGKARRFKVKGETQTQTSRFNLLAALRNPTHSSHSKNEVRLAHQL
jgi:checkpoint serine/threonine-protein kinase